MKKAVFIGIAVIMVMSSIFLVGSFPAGSVKSEATLLEFNSMVGVPKAYTGVLSPIRGLNGGGLPWVISSGQGELKADGSIEVKVRGLVLDPNDPTVISRGLAGQNPIPQMMVVVSCQSVDAGGTANFVNVSTKLFAVTTGLASQGGGNANFEDSVSLPKSCIAPIVFVTSPTSAWFATTGN
jgi:hypothetical protein